MLATLAASALANDLVTTSKAEWGPFSVTDGSQAVMTYSGATYWREALEGEQSPVYNIVAEGSLAAGPIQVGDSFGQWQCWESKSLDGGYVCHMFAVSKTAEETSVDYKRYSYPAAPPLTDDETDPPSFLAGNPMPPESHSVMSFPSAAGSEPSISVVVEGSHELLSATTITDDSSFKAVVKGDYTTEE